GIDVLRCRRPSRNHRAGFTKGGTVHSLVVNDCTLFLPLLIGATVGPYPCCRSESSLPRLDRRVGMGPSHDVVIVHRPYKLSFGHAALIDRSKRCCEAPSTDAFAQRAHIGADARRVHAVVAAALPAGGAHVDAASRSVADDSDDDIVGEAEPAALLA